jgi:hypothetical protein
LMEGERMRMDRVLRSERERERQRERQRERDRERWRDTITLSVKSADPVK